MPGLTQDQLAALRASHSPQAHRGIGGVDRLIISMVDAAQPLAKGVPHGTPLYIVSDFSGYLCATADTEALLSLIALEHTGGQDTVRQLITGKGPPPEPLHNQRPRAGIDLFDFDLDDLEDLI